MKSIRTYLVVIILSVVCLSNFIAALRGYKDSLESANKLMAHQILEKLNTLTALVNSGVTIPERLYDDHTLFQIWKDGNLITKSSNSPATLFVNSNNDFHIASYQGERWRVYGKTLKNNKTYIVVASKFDVYSKLTEDILLRAIAPIIWILPIVGLLVLLVVNIGLKPVKKLTKSLSHRKANNFSPLSNDEYAGELAPIVTALNSLFLRLSEAFDRERHFSSDAAHELRTPLAALKVNLHNLSNTLEHSQDLEIFKRTIERMEHCIEQLLAMHRSSLEVDDAELQPCDLNQIAQNTIAEIYDLIQSRNQKIVLSGTESYVLADAASLSILLRNLIDNASKYTPVNGNIFIAINQKENTVKLLVEDSGPGIPESEYTRVLDRFYRIRDDQHNLNTTGSGLGLSIVSFIVEKYKGKLLFSQSLNLGGLAVEVSFPDAKDKALL